MIRRLLLLFAFPSFCSVALHARDVPKPTSDSAAHGEKTFLLNEVVVTATRTATALDDVPSAVDLVSREQINAQPGGLLSSVLNAMPGLYIRSYGGGGAVQVVSLRGMAPEHTLVLIDGQRYNSFQNGQADFGLLSSSDVQRVEIVRGGYSSLYGADAVGGVINVITRQPTEDMRASIAGGLGSDGYSSQEFSLSGSEYGLGWTGKLRNETGKGDYEFRFSDGRTTTMLRRSGDDFRMLTGDARLTYAAAEGLRADLALFYSTADRGSPGAVTDVQSGGKARLADDVARMQMNLDWTASPSITGSLKSSVQYSRETYNDPLTLINGSPQMSLYTNRTFLLSPELRYAGSADFTGNAGIEFARATLSSSEVNQALRLQRSAFVSTQHVIPLPFEVPFDIALYPSLRYDSFSDVSADLSPRIGLNVGLLRDPEVRVRASYGKSFRAPAFNDLYWKAGGNPALKAERSLGFDCGALSTVPLYGTLHLDISYFSIMTDDRIVWIPSSDGHWSPENITSVQSSGFEGEIRWEGFDGVVTLAMNSTWITARKESSDFPGDPTEGKLLIYIPRQTVNASATVRFREASLYLEHSWVSYRYTTETNDRFLPSYALLSAAIRVPVHAGILTTWAKVEGTNLLNTSYQIIALYPMPLRQFRATLGVDL